MNEEIERVAKDTADEAVQFSRRETLAETTQRELARAQANVARLEELAALIEEHPGPTQ